MRDSFFFFFFRNTSSRYFFLTHRVKMFARQYMIINVTILDIATKCNFKKNNKYKNKRHNDDRSVENQRTSIADRVEGNATTSSKSNEPILLLNNKIITCSVLATTYSILRRTVSGRMVRSEERRGIRRRAGIIVVVHLVKVVGDRKK